MEMAGSLSALDVSAIKEDLKYSQALSVNVSNFVSVKLSGLSNYEIWKAQMLCLIKSQALLHIIDAENHFPEDKGVHMIAQYDELVKGWIFSSMKEKVLKDFVDLGTAQEVWKKLELLNVSIIYLNSEDRVDFTFGIESLRDVPELENGHSIRRKKELYDAAVEGCWWKAKSILKKHQSAATEAITANGNTILHLAVERGHNYFLEKLLEFVEDIETKNQKGRTALHIAAMVGNTHAAQLLVQKKKELLVNLDHNQESPLDCAFSNMKLNMSTYLLKSAMSSDLSFDARGLAWELLNKFPSDYPIRETALMAITVTFPTELGFMESFIYPSFDNVRKKTFRRVPIATLYPVYLIIFALFLLLRLTLSMLYFLLWKVLVVTVHPIKNIEKKKKDYQEAKKILSLICTQLGTSTNNYKEAILEAVRQGTYEVVDEILFASPTTINCKDKNGHNIIQLAIINRSEKVYNLIHHIIERTESYRTTKDSSQNNFVHLAGRLAPSFVLDRTTGAALQLQRELKWREEMEKLMLPLELIEENFHKETPAMMFTREHQDLMKQGEIWMKETAGSCSITAALIVTVVFAAAITVPGGSNQESGIPVFKNETAFTVFAVFNAFSLYTAAAALLLFLSILTARFSERDFLVSLPRRLILGLLTLFLSTTAMIVAFGAILFLVFCDSRPWMLAPICVFTCLPISVIVTIKLPLLVDLIQSTYFPIFGQQSYLESCKINTKNTTFMR
ncbi:uncharacterized protein LOC143591122 [Bidens hawaiensis]|uniref:uncharacterized protein LOC143591122 n=1 Tax=Bidens hawaiensis TaxID=980011 RepID=UPI004048FE4A